jgi:hypothetical protein
MPADLWDDDDDDLLDPMAQHAAQRPIGREVHANGNYGVQRYVLTSNIIIIPPLSLSLSLSLSPKGRSLQIEVQNMDKIRLIFLGGIFIKS